ncbi:MAG: RNA polymerase sigma factor [Sphingobacteriales bacterium]|nr:RNA polymerase sigma factor [Sphingobacteriales bacterium]
MSNQEFAEILNSNVDFLKPFAFTLTRDNETAKDLTQETIFRAWANKDKYNVGTNIKAWMYTIMRNIFINDYRKKSRQNVVFDKSPNDFLIDNNQNTVSNGAESSLRLKEIETAIQNLPDIFRYPFVLYFEGYKYNEISDYLQEPLGTVKSRIHFARKLLKSTISRN